MTHFMNVINFIFDSLLITHHSLLITYSSPLLHQKSSYILMFNPLDGIPVLFISCNNHFGIIIVNLKEITEFPSDCLVTVKDQCNLDIDLFIIPGCYKICFMILLPSCLYITSPEKQFIINNILNDLCFIIRFVTNNGIANTNIFKIIFFTRFKNPFLLNIIPQNSAYQESIIQITCIYLHLIMWYHHLLRLKKITYAF